MKYDIKHITVFRYEDMVEQSLNQIRLKPRNTECQRLISYNLKIAPMSMTKEYIDIWSNTIESFFIAEKHNELVIISNSIVSVQRAPYIYTIQFSDKMREIFFSQLFKEQYLAYLSTSSFTYLREGQKMEILSNLPDPTLNPIQFALKVMAYLYNTIEYDADATTIETTAEEAFDLKRGVCQDYTHIMLSVLRHVGIPTRYISGYLYVGQGDDLIGETATHAWVEIMVPGIGWIGIDPTNNVEVLENHINLSVGRDFRDVSPVEGVYQGGKQTLEVNVEIKKIDHL